MSTGMVTSSPFTIIVMVGHLGSHGLNRDRVLRSTCASRGRRFKSIRLDDSFKSCVTPRLRALCRQHLCRPTSNLDPHTCGFGVRVRDALISPTTPQYV